MRFVGHHKMGILVQHHFFKRDGGLLHYFAVVIKPQMGFKRALRGDSLATRIYHLSGVHALLPLAACGKNPSPPVTEGVTDAMIDAIFAPLPADEEWKPL